MFKVPTTIILGAGASHSYGYPIGSDLIDELIRLCEFKIEKDVGHNYLDFPSLHKLLKSLRFYDPISIDAFLHHYRKDEILVVTAKKLISEILLTVNNAALFERGASLASVKHHASDDESNWYRFVWDAIISELTAEELADDDRDLNFSVITFNYDDSLEYYLLSRIHSKHSMFKDDQKQKVATKILDRIEHVYGSLEKGVSVSVEGKVEDVSFQRMEPDIITHLVNTSYSNIRLINEREEADYKHLQNLIIGKSQVIFLGFGFDDINIGPKVLDLGKTLRARPNHDRADYEYSPVIKYTNLYNSERINRKLNRILFQKKNDDDSRWTQRKKGIGVIKSEKKVYQALAEDFQLNDF